MKHISQHFNGSVARVGGYFAIKNYEFWFSLATAFHDSSDSTSNFSIMSPTEKKKVWQENLSRLFRWK